MKKYQTTINASLTVMAAFAMGGCSLSGLVEDGIDTCTQLQQTENVQKQMDEARRQGQTELVVKAGSGLSRINCIYEL